MLDRQIFQNKDLVLKVSPDYNPSQFDPNKYEAFLDALCSDREYQKEAIRETDGLQKELNYYFKFLSPSSYDLFFKSLREKTYKDFRSEIEARLEE